MFCCDPVPVPSHEQSAKCRQEVSVRGLGLGFRVWGLGAGGLGFQGLEFRGLAFRAYPKAPKASTHGALKF